MPGVEVQFSRLLLEWKLLAVLTLVAREKTKITSGAHAHVHVAGARSARSGGSCFMYDVL